MLKNFENKHKIAVNEHVEARGQLVEGQFSPSQGFLWLTSAYQVGYQKPLYLPDLYLKDTP